VVEMGRTKKERSLAIDAQEDRGDSSEGLKVMGGKKVSEAESSETPNHAIIHLLPVEGTGSPETSSWFS
jgi:hypothetical protein